MLGLILIGWTSGVAGQPQVPELTDRVVDLADLLSPEAEQAIADRSRVHEDSTSSQVAVLTVPSLNGEDLEDWATLVFRTWSLGQAELNNGVLLLIARDEREVRIEVGTGVEEDLTDAESGQIIRDEITPRFREEDFDGGVLAAVDAIVGSLDGTYDPPRGPGFGIGWFWLAGLVIGFGAMWYVSANGYEEKTAVFESGCAGWLFGIPLSIVLIRETGAWWGLLILLALPVLLYVGNWLLDRHPTLGEKRREKRRIWRILNDAQKEGKTHVMIDGVEHSVPSPSSSQASRLSGSSSRRTTDSSSSGSWSRAFSGGGGSSSGGGASGGW